MWRFCPIRAADICPRRFFRIEPQRWYKISDNAHTGNMGRKNSKKIIDEVFEGGVSAHECTGALQKISVDPEEVARFHAEYTGERKSTVNKR